MFSVIYLATISSSFQNIEQNFIFCNEFDKNSELETLCQKLISEEPQPASVFPKTIIFANKKISCEGLVNLLKKNYPINCLHGDKEQLERDQVLKNFKTGKINILVATDVAARGMDISDVKYVINFDYPNDIDSYIHRIGRTGRSGKLGKSYTLFTSQDSNKAQELINVLSSAGQKIPSELSEYGSVSYSRTSKRRNK